MGCLRLKSRFLAGLCSFWKLQGSPFLCLFQHRGAAHSPWLMVSSSILEASGVTSESPSDSFYQTHLDNPEGSLHLKVLSLIPSAQSLLLYKGLGRGCLGWGGGSQDGERKRESPCLPQLCCAPSRFSHVWLFVTLWTIAHQAPLSMGFSREEHWSGLPFPLLEDLPNPGVEPMSHVSCCPQQLGQIYPTVMSNTLYLSRASQRMKSTPQGAHPHIMRAVAGCLLRRNLGLPRRQPAGLSTVGWWHGLGSLQNLLVFYKTVSSPPHLAWVFTYVDMCLAKRLSSHGNLELHAACVFVRAKSFQLCLILCDPMDRSPPSSSVHEILQARTLEWVAMPFSRASSQPRDRTCVFCLLHGQAGSLSLVPPGKPPCHIPPIKSWLGKMLFRDPSTWELGSPTPPFKCPWV